MKKYFLFILFFIFIVGGGTLATRYILRVVSLHRLIQAEQLLTKAEMDKIEAVLQKRKDEQLKKNTPVNLFDENGQVKILVIGLDKRVGQTQGHCDVIQFITLDEKKQEITITAVPRGTYSPLPLGKGVTSTDYYVSNACGLGGLEYGITQIEKILGQKADFIVVVGFSETLGILRALQLPTTDTLQWLRRRQGYAIGEPQRARNHSTFLKQLLTQYVPKEQSSLDTTWRYLLYKLVQTDLSFAQAEALFEAVAKMELPTHPERIHLSMKPAYAVQDIPYNPEHLNIRPGADTEDSIQKKLLSTIEQKKSDAKFVAWAFENDLWLQVEDAQKREAIHYEFLEKYVQSFKDAQERQALIADYILEMEHRAQGEWLKKGKELLKKELP